MANAGSRVSLLTGQRDGWPHHPEPSYSVSICQCIYSLGLSIRFFVWPTEVARDNFPPNHEVGQDSGNAL